MTYLKQLIATSVLVFAASTNALADDRVAPRLTDPQISEVVITVNNAEIQVAQLAVLRAQAMNVRNFARMLIRHHTLNNRQTDLVDRRLRIVPVDSFLSQELRTNVDQQLLRLRTDRRARFDRAFLDQQILMHQQALDIIDNQLLPAATESRLRILLRNTRPVVADHLRMAQNMRSAMITPEIE